MNSSKEIDIGGHKIVARVFNKEKTGIPVIFIHGITATIDFWEPVQTPIFKKNFRWYSLSLPGHYPAKLPSGFHNESLTADMMAQVLTDAIKELIDDQPVILAGHSTGRHTSESRKYRQRPWIYPSARIQGPYGQKRPRSSPAEKNSNAFASTMEKPQKQSLVISLCRSQRQRHARRHKANQQKQRSNRFSKGSENRWYQQKSDGAYSEAFMGNPSVGSRRQLASDPSLVGPFHPGHYQCLHTFD